MVVQNEKYPGLRQLHESVSLLLLLCQMEVMIAAERMQFPIDVTIKDPGGDWLLDVLAAIISFPIHGHCFCSRWGGCYSSDK